MPLSPPHQRIYLWSRHYALPLLTGLHVLHPGNVIYGRTHLLCPACPHTSGQALHLARRRPWVPRNEKGFNRWRISGLQKWKGDYNGWIERVCIAPDYRVGSNSQRLKGPCFTSTKAMALPALKLAPRKPCPCRRRKCAAIQVGAVCLFVQ